MDYDWKKLTAVLRQILEEEVASGRECGCQLAIYHHGELKVDLAAGFTDETRQQPLNTGNLFPIYSSGKPFLATAMLQQVEQGKISLDTPLSELWQEFTGAGKEKITVLHMLSHRAGLHILPKLDNDLQIADWELMCSKLAAAEPRYAAGEHCSYHAVTYAWLLGEPLCRLLGKPLKQIMHENILTPAGISGNMFFGTDDAADTRLAFIDETGVEPRPSWHVQMMHTPAIRHACLPSFNGCGTAEALAKFYAVLAGDIPEHRLLSRELLDEATLKLQPGTKSSVDEKAWNHFGMGIVLGGPVNDRNRLFGHGGAAGAEGFYDRKTGIALGFVKNRLLMEHPHHPVRNRISEALALPIRHW